MKKISFIAASLAMMAGVGLTSCVQDTEPRIAIPTEFVLNQPAVGNNVVYLNENSTIDLSWSQPNYGLGIVPNYTIQISDTPEFKNEEGEDNFVVYPTIYTQAKTTLEGQDLALFLQDWKGWTMDQVPTTPVTIYLRINSEVPNYPEGTIQSNVVALNVVSYYVVTEPGTIWLIGAPQGWNIASAEGWELRETEIGSNIYKGSFEIPKDEFTFRFYTKLGDWENNSIGSQEPDDDLDITMPYSGPAVNGKGKWHVPDWEGGEITITVNLNDMTVDFKAGAEAKCIWLVGAPEGWNIDDATGWELYETAKGSDVYAGTFDIPAGQFTFRFYSELGDWNAHSIGSQEPDEDVDITMPYSGEIVDGKGKWNVAGWAGGTVSMTVDLKNKTVNFESVE